MNTKLYTGDRWVVRRHTRREFTPKRIELNNENLTRKWKEKHAADDVIHCNLSPEMEAESERHLEEWESSEWATWLKEQMAKMTKGNTLHLLICRLRAMRTCISMISIASF
ncbi:MAG: hypothetical protein LQ343_004872 [Gyalolechia ehrenbergii]|nr:MAG: hypothetical protein LQ343_004872 [Gyalolechia ehrenbergii]